MRFNNKTKSDEIIRYRLYKSKKNWVIASTVFLSFFAASALNAVNLDIAHADTTVQASTSGTPQVADSSADTSSAILSSPSASDTPSSPSSSSSTPTSDASTSDTDSSSSSSDEQGLFISATISFIDDTNKSVLMNVKLSSFLNNLIEYDYNADINKYLNAGYYVVSNDIPSTGIVGSSQGNTYTIHLAHKLVTYNSGDSELSSINGLESLTKDLNVKDIITMPDGSTSTGSTFLIQLTRTVTADFTKRNADGSFSAEALSYSDWQTPNSITTINPGYTKLSGYTPKFNVSYSSNGVIVRINDDGSLNLKLDLSDKNLFAAIHRTINYIPDSQIIKINFIDDDNNGSNIQTIYLDGVTNSSITYSVREQINELVANHYLLVSSDLPANSIFTFDNLTDLDQVFNIHFKHATKVLTATNPDNGDASMMKRDITETVNYVSEDGTVLADPTVKKMSFMRYGVEDLVTKAITYESSWILVAGSNTFTEISVPNIEGYNSDIKKIDSISDVEFDSHNFNYTVTFVKNHDKPTASSADSSDTDSESSGPSSSNADSSATDSESSATSNADSSSVPSSETSLKNLNSNSSSSDLTINDIPSLDSSLDYTVNTESSSTLDLSLHSSTAEIPNESSSQSEETAAESANDSTTTNAAQNNNYLNKSALEQESSFTSSGSNQTTHHIDANKVVASPSGSDDDGGGGGGAGGGNEDISLGSYFSSLAGTIIFAQA